MPTDQSRPSIDPVLLPSRRVSLGRLLQVFVLIALFAGERHTLGLDFFSDSKSEIKGLKLALCQDPGLEPAAICRVERIFGDFQTRGFFRIGVLPLTVLDRLSIEIRDLDRLSRALTNTSEYFCQRDSRKAIEGRDFTLSFTSAKSGRIISRRVRLAGHSEWQLEDGSVEQPSLPVVAFSRATLTICGPLTGELLCNTTNGPLRLDVRSLLPVRKPVLERGADQVQTIRSFLNTHH